VKEVVALAQTTHPLDLASFSFEQSNLFLGQFRLLVLLFLIADGGVVLFAILD
jgi:hypothetical protein